MCAVSLRALNDEYGQILDLLGRLYSDSLDQPPGDTVAGELRDLLGQVEAHFAHERDLMTLTRYPDAVDHEEAHGLIRRTLAKLAEAATRREVTRYRAEVPFLVHLVLEYVKAERNQRHGRQPRGTGRKRRASPRGLMGRIVPVPFRR